MFLSFSRNPDIAMTLNQIKGVTFDTPCRGGGLELHVYTAAIGLRVRVILILCW